MVLATGGVVSYDRALLTEAAHSLLDRLTAEGNRN